MSPAPPGAEPLCLALDIGGTKVDAAVIAPSGDVLRRERIATAGSDSALFDDIGRLLERVRGDFAVGVLGVGCGGPMELDGARVSPLNIPAWRGFPLHAALVGATGLDVRIDNDAKALALAEGRFGAARHLQNYLSMVVSTGVGGGVVLDGRLLDGLDGNAGHIGHLVVEPQGRRCPCGSRGCLEAEASGAAIAAITGRPPAEAPEAVRERTGTLVGRAVSSAAALFDLDRCFIAGSVALNFGPSFFRAANEAVRQWARIEFIRALRIEPSALGDDGPLLGAAAVGWRDLS